MKSRRSLVVAGLLALVLLCGVATSHAAGRRTPQQIAQEIQAVGQELAPLFASPQDLFDARKREAAAPKAIPTLRKMVAAGWHGTKSGRGFYDYSGDEPVAVDPGL